MIDKWLIVGGAHFAVTAAILKLFYLTLPNCITCYYSATANFLLYIIVARFTFELTKKWYLNEKLQPENRAVFITGCDSGSGLALAKRLDFNGYPVFAGCVDPSSSGAKILKLECSKRLQIVEINVGKDDSVKKAAQFVKDNIGTSELWAIVNNDEIQRGFEVELTDINEFKETMEINGFGPVRVTKAFLPLLRQSRGRIINMTNPAGTLTLPYLTPYTMSKFAAMAFNQCLKQELDIWGIRVISIEPTFSKDGLANPETMKKNIEKTFCNLEPDIKDDYGERYIKNFKTFIDFMCSFCLPKSIGVIDAIDNAIGMKYPNSEYKPSRNFVFQVATYILEKGPLLLTHLFMKTLLFVSGFPTPKEAENYL